MAIPHYLAMTAAEMASAASLPSKAAWMACHFSPYGTGLGNLPEELPPGSLLILNDRTPIHGHDPEQIADQLNATIHRLQCSALLLDFQNPRTPEAAELADYLAGSASCPVAVSRDYQVDGAAVFLPPVPTDTTLQAYLAPWQGQKIWLETALEGQTITLTKSGAAFSENRCRDYSPYHTDPSLFCHYSIQEDAEAILFHTWRTMEDLQLLLNTAEEYGVEGAVGLYQEMG